MLPICREGHLDDFHGLSGIARGRSGDANTDPRTFPYWVGRSARRFTSMVQAHGPPACPPPLQISLAWGAIW
jgi:hypothetical protein